MNKHATIEFDTAVPADATDACALLPLATMHPKSLLDLPLPLLPLRSGIVLPGSVVSLPVGRMRSRALAETVPLDGVVALAVQKNPSQTDPELGDLHEVGVIARVRQKTDRGDRGILLLVEGLARFRPLEIVGREPYLRVRGEVLDELRADSDEAKELASTLRKQLVADNEVHDTTILSFMTDAGDGIMVRAEAVGSRLRGNVSTSNFADGIDVRSPTTRLRDKHRLLTRAAQ